MAESSEKKAIMEEQLASVFPKLYGLSQSKKVLVDEGAIEDELAEVIGTFELTAQEIMQYFKAPTGCKPEILNHAAILINRAFEKAKSTERVNEENLKGDTKNKELPPFDARKSWEKFCKMQGWDPNGFNN